MPDTPDPTRPARPAAAARACPQRPRGAAAGAGPAPRRNDPAGAGLLPLDYMLEVLRDPEASPADKRWAAEKAAPYLHARRATAAPADDPALRHEELLEALEDPRP